MKEIITPQMRQRADQILEENWMGTHTIPSGGKHKKHYLKKFDWDSSFIEFMNGHRGDLDKAVTEQYTGLKAIDPKTGFIPNMVLYGRRTWRDLEWITFSNSKKNKKEFHSSYTQPPLQPWSAWETYQRFQEQGREDEGREFLSNMFGEVTQDRVSGLRGAYDYFAKHRENGNGSHLIGIYHPHEDGRDSSPDNDDERFLIRWNGKLRKKNGKVRTPRLNTVFDTLGFLKINIKAKMVSWEPEKMRNIYWVNDVMFNCIYANGLRSMAKISLELGEVAEAERYTNIANTVEAEILEGMWNGDEGKEFFYNRDKHGKQSKNASVGGLLPITLDTIPKPKLIKLLDKLEDPEWFGTEYPIPSLPTHSDSYDPGYTLKRLWLGPTWINMNHIIAEEGLVKQIERFSKGKDKDEQLCKRMISILKNLVEATEKMVGEDLEKNNTSHEFYNPHTKKGYRIEGFAWSLLGLHLHKSKALLEKFEAAF